jgi:membrane associated rhomboid family serine protease
MKFLRKPFRYSFSNATFVLIAANLAVFFLTMLFPRLEIYLSLSLAGLVRRWFWQPVTYLFVHSGFSHILFNMIALFFFGFPVEKSLGTKEFLLFYFFCGILDGIFSVFLYFFLGTNVFLMGASGAIYALLLAYAVIFPRSMIYIWGIIPVPSPLLVLIYGAISLFSQIMGGGGVAHLAHLMGFVLAWIYFLARMGINPVKVWKDAWKN